LTETHARRIAIGEFNGGLERRSDVGKGAGIPGEPPFAIVDYAQ
jgi:hypothetical protein